MVEEVMRRLRNCSPEMRWEEKGVFLTEYAREMKNSGHDEEFRKEVMKRAVTKYKQELKDHNSGKKDMYRNREERERDYKEKGGRATSDSWFRKKKSNKKTTSILRVPYTGGKLKGKIDKTLKKMKSPRGTNTLAQEDSGEKLLHKLVRPDPFPAGNCGREGCKTIVKDIEGGCNGTCWQQHVNYTIKCKKCEMERKKDEENGLGPGVRYEYRGESSRGCFKRYNSHIRAGENGFMSKHEREKHEGQQGIEYIIKREKIDKDPMRRILRESIRIESAAKDRSVKLMNTKEEHFGVQTVRAQFSRDYNL